MKANKNISLSVVLSEINFLLVKHNQSSGNKEIVFNRVKSAFRQGYSPAKSFSIGLKDITYLSKRGY